jgi:tetratricopeptide (TPR) repeat protein
MKFQAIIPVFAILIGVGMTVAFRKPPKTEDEINLNLIPPPQGIKHFTFGFDEIMGDTLWLRLLQDFSVCENAKDGVAHTEGRSSTEPMCKKSWVFQMLNAITDLAPHWRLPYATGAIMLSVIVDDREGASRIFEKALRQFPNDYSLNYRAAYHYLWEEKAPDKAAKYLLKAAQAGGPSWMYALAGKIYSEAGQLDLAIQVVEDGLKERADEKALQRLENRLAELKAKREKLKNP